MIASPQKVSKALGHFLTEFWGGKYWEQPSISGKAEQVMAMINKVEVDLISFNGPLVRKRGGVCINHWADCPGNLCIRKYPLFFLAGTSIKHAQGPSTPSRDFMCLAQELCKCA